MKIYLDGKLVDAEEAKVSVFDHGLLYGDGVFEGIRVYDRLVFKFAEHMDRLFKSAAAIGLTMPMAKDGLIAVTVETLKANAIKDGYIRLIVTRGAGDLGLDPRKCPKPMVIIIADKIALYPEKYYKEGLEIITAKTRRNYPQALDPRIKSLNYLNNILAKIDAINAGTEEAIMLTYDGNIAECTGDNIFMVKGRELITPPVSLGALEGITRDAVIGLAGSMGISFHEKVIRMDDIYGADEVFLTGTAAEIVPVVRIDECRIDDGKPGEITLGLTKEFKKLTKTDGVRYALRGMQ